MTLPLPAKPITGADAAIAFALQQLGKPYQWGGVGPNSFDCSGLTMKAYAAGGVTIPRTSEMQMRSGQAVGSLALALPGDLIFPYVNGSHVAMYLGNNQIVEAPQDGVPVHVVKYYGSAGGIRRLVEGGGSTVPTDFTSSTSGMSGGVSTTQDFAGFMTQVQGTAKALTNPKEWASFGFLILGLYLLFMVAVVTLGSKSVKGVEHVIGIGNKVNKVGSSVAKVVNS